MAARVRPVELLTRPSLEDHGLVEEQNALAASFVANGRALADQLKTSRVWMINSTATGGGVAEMLPHTCGLLREAGIDARWLVLEPDDPRFFTSTKALHHMLHGKPADPIDAHVFERVSREGAHALVEHLEPGDVVVMHDPQPAGMVAFLPDELSARLVWRCHIGVPFQNEHTEAAWNFLEPWLQKFSRLLFSSERYVPATMKPKSDVIHPAIDPLSHKNRELSPYKMLGILRSAGLIEGDVPPWAQFESRIERYADGAFKRAPLPSLTSSPIILHVSRFDPLKGFDRSIAAFDLLCSRGLDRARHLRAAQDRVVDELSRCNLILAGPDPLGVADDPEARRVLADLCARVDALADDIRARVHIMKIPMNNAKENALMVNALQRMASVIVQPSIEEGFGLTVTEALWKRVPVVASAVGGIAQQIRPGVDGLLVESTDGVLAFAEAIVSALALVKQSERMARSARQRVASNFLSLREAARWLDVVNAVVAGRPDTKTPAITAG